MKTHLIDGYNVTVITDAGLTAGAKTLHDIAPNTNPMIAELILNMVRSDWSQGHEDRVEKHLMQVVDLTGAKRVLIAMLVASGATTVL
ncbi:hypothetical protein [Curtobacterium sp. MCSS17_016]|uniref:hypothetical protein n=1 Tax=Curtobacterium sp. MCSS17_016 TaxID=2175644 RepID=UPI000DA8854C|nr:hypothetical protein [Curtobacterium sp. MCSS17_016]WIE81250.1 hypothetical protein DEJ19_018625 [Curtobacterium sp. MCSS17_016]